MRQKIWQSNWSCEWQEGVYHGQLFLSEPHKNSGFFATSTSLSFSSPQHPQTSPKPGECPKNLLNVPLCCWYLPWSSCREVTTQCPAASLGQADEVKQTHSALQWLMLFSTPPDTLTWQTRMNIIHPLGSPMMFRLFPSWQIQKSATAYFMWCEDKHTPLENSFLLGTEDKK